MEPETVAILNAVTHFGCILKSQAIEFMPPSPYNREEKFKKIINNMLATQKIKAKDEFLTSLESGIDYNAIDSLWVMMEINKKLSSSPVPLYELIEESFVGTGTEKINFILDKKRIVHIVPINIDTDLTTAVFLQDKYFAKGNGADDENARNLYFFVFRNRDLAEAFTKLKLTVPHGVAILEGGIKEKPVITLFQTKN